MAAVATEELSTQFAAKRRSERRCYWKVIRREEEE